MGVFEESVTSEVDIALDVQYDDSTESFHNRHLQICISSGIPRASSICCFQLQDKHHPCGVSCQTGLSAAMFVAQQA